MEMHSSQVQLSLPLKIFSLILLFIIFAFGAGILICFFLSSLFTVQTVDDNPKLNHKKRLLIKIINVIQMIVTSLTLFKFLISYFIPTFVIVLFS